MREPPVPSEALRNLLRGFSASTIAACAEFQVNGGNDAFERALAGIIEHHLSTPPAQPVLTLPGSTRLVADLGLDSFAMVEMAFLFEDLFSADLAQEELVKVVTLDDLRALLRAHTRPPPP